MNPDKLTTYLGLAQAVAVSLIDYITTSHTDGSINWANPVWYIGMAVATLMAVKAYYTNKT